jgi:tetratricopeptide (TPR) repeat protein
MKSRLLLSLELSSANGSDLRSMAALRTKRAIYFARRGDFTEAQLEIDHLRSLKGRDAFGDSIAGANLAEAVISAFSGPLSRSLDKLRRATIIIGDPSKCWVGRLCLAWQIHVLQNLWRSESIPSIANLLIESVDSTEHDVISRFASVVAVGLHLSGEYPLARPWYECARLHALAEGDDLTIDANLYNVAATRLNNLSLSNLFGEIDESELERAAWEVASSVNYDGLGGVAVFPWSVDMMKGRLALLQGNFELAIVELDRALSLNESDLPAHYRAMALAERAYCASKIDDLPSATRCIESAISTIPGEMSDDDLALIYGYSGRVYGYCENSDLSSNFGQASAGRLARFRCTQEISARALTRLSLPPPPPRKLSVDH